MSNGMETSSPVHKVWKPECKFYRVKIQLQHLVISLCDDMTIN